MSGFSVPQYTFFYNGQVAANGSVYVYQTDTTTPVTVYSDGGLTSPITNPINLDSNGQAKFYVSGTVALKLVAYTGLAGAGILIETVDPVYPISSSSASSTLPWAVAGGTADAITATFSPAITSLTDGLLLSFRATAANATATPTFSPNGLTPLVITQKGGSALIAGNIAANLAEYIVRYNLANTRWELLNPAAASLNASPITNSLTADVLLNNTGTFFDGPSVAQGTSGTWYASGTVTLTDMAAGSCNFFAKLWDGTTVIDSCVIQLVVANTTTSISLSGFIPSPAGNLRISVKDGTATTGKILFNNTSFSKDSTITAFRIA